MKQTKEAEFQLLHVSLLREYIHIEFSRSDKTNTANASPDDQSDGTAKGNSSSKPPSSSTGVPSSPHDPVPVATDTVTSSLDRSLDRERLVDDFVFLTFLVGNDFLPHLPTLDIGEEAFDVVFTAYKTVQKEMYLQKIQSLTPETSVANTMITESEVKISYLTCEGEIADMDMLERLFHLIGVQEAEILSERDADIREFSSRRRRRPEDASGGPTVEEIEEAEAALQAAYEEALFAQRLQELQLTGKDSVDEGVRSGAVEGSPQDSVTATLGEGFDFDLPDGGLSAEEELTLLQRAHGAGSASVLFLEGLMKSYLEGLMWCLCYYSKGCVSWTWYFPYHYGPMLQDMKNLKYLWSKIQFQLGQPFRPFQQLLGCLPPLSKNLLPKPYQWLMTSDQSPIKDFYPETFKIDMNGKRAPWEAVVLLPFIDETKLVVAENTYCSESMLTRDETARNAFGRIMYYVFDPAVTATIYSCNPSIGLKDISNCQSREEELPPDIHPSRAFKSELIPGTVSPCPGFPSLSMLPIAGVRCEAIKLNVFGSESKYSTLILELQSSRGAVERLGSNLERILGKCVYVNYPSMVEARVVGVTTVRGEARLTADNTVARTVWEEGSDESKNWMREAGMESSAYLRGRGKPGTGGIDIGELHAWLVVLPLQGMIRDLSTGARTKKFGTVEAKIPINMALWVAPVEDPRFIETAGMEVSELFPLNSMVIALDGPHRGKVGRVAGPHGPPDKSGAAKMKREIKREVGKSVPGPRNVIVEFPVLPEEVPFGLTIAASIRDQYYSVSDVCRATDISPSLFGKIVGAVFVEPGRRDFGLNLKRNGQYQLLGYVRRVEMTQEGRDGTTAAKGNVWKEREIVQVIGTMTATVTPSDQEKGRHGSGSRIQAMQAGDGLAREIFEYSTKAIALIMEYKIRFPLLFRSLEGLPHMPKYTLDALFGAEKGAQMADEVSEWLKAHPVSLLPRTPMTSASLSREAIAAIERAADVRSSSVSVLRASTEKPVVERDVYLAEKLFCVDSYSATDVPITMSLTRTISGQAGESSFCGPRLGDRVVNLRGTGVPFGLRGTVVSIHTHTLYVEVLFDEEFIGGRSLQGSCSQFRGRILPWDSLLTIVTPFDDIISERAAVPPSSSLPYRNQKQPQPSNRAGLLEESQQPSRRPLKPIGRRAADDDTSVVTTAPVSALSSPSGAGNEQSMSAGKKLLQILRRPHSSSTSQSSVQNVSEAVPTSNESSFPSAATAPFAPPISLPSKQVAVQTPTPTSAQDFPSLLQRKPTTVSTAARMIKNSLGLGHEPQKSGTPIDVGSSASPAADAVVSSRRREDSTSPTPVLESVRTPDALPSLHSASKTNGPVNQDGTAVREERNINTSGITMRPVDIKRLFEVEARSRTCADDQVAAAGGQRGHSDPSVTPVPPVQVRSSVSDEKSRKLWMVLKRPHDVAPNEPSVLMNEKPSNYVQEGLVESGQNGLDKDTTERILQAGGNKFDVGSDTVEMAVSREEAGESIPSILGDDVTVGDRAGQHQDLIHAGCIPSALPSAVVKRL
eukprot:gene1408-1603_t